MQIWLIVAVCCFNGAVVAYDLYKCLQDDVIVDLSCFFLFSFYICTVYFPLFFIVLLQMFDVMVAASCFHWPCSCFYN